MKKPVIVLLLISVVVSINLDAVITIESSDICATEGQTGQIPF